jgi:hypothetical protein
MDRVSGSSIDHGRPKYTSSGVRGNIRLTK